MIRACILGVFIFAAAPAPGQIVNNDGSKAEWLEFHKDGSMRLDLQAGKHRATVEFTVAEPPQGWPDAMWIGPSRADMASDSYPDRMIIGVDIMVDGCAVDQPWPALGGFATPSVANLQFVRGHWQLYIGGGDGAESYGIIYAFDSKHILARELTWGPVSDEDTRYKITVDPDVAPRYCEPSEQLIPAQNK